jgi:hypothetical protein
MIHAHTLTCGNPYTTPDDGAARLLATAILAQAVEDLQSRSYYHRTKAAWWLQQPEAQGLADVLDLALPDVSSFVDSAYEAYRQAIHDERDQLSTVEVRP